jgi:hypothetical protein
VGRATGGEGYTVADHLLTIVCDLLVAANWQRANAGAPPNKQSKKPEPLPRPGSEPERKAISSAQLRAQLARARAKVIKEVNDV